MSQPISLKHANVGRPVRSLSEVWPVLRPHFLTLQRIKELGLRVNRSKNRACSDWTLAKKVVVNIKACLFTFYTARFVLSPGRS